jgi:hypothetical protein
MNTCSSTILAVCEHLRTLLLLLLLLLVRAAAKLMNCTGRAAATSTVLLKLCNVLRESNSPKAAALVAAAVQD